MLAKEAVLYILCYIPIVRPPEGSAPVAIFDGKLEIDLDEINDIINEFG